MSSIVVIGILLRLIPHPANMAPIGAIALFGGVYLAKRYALILPFLTLFFSDIVLGFYSAMPFVYGSFLLTGCIGIWLKEHKSFKNIVLGAALSSVMFFLITNFGVWVFGNMYPRTLAGLLTAYGMGLPFFRNTLIGDLLYTGILFGAYETGLLVLQSRGVKKA